MAAIVSIPQSLDDGTFEDVLDQVQNQTLTGQRFRTDKLMARRSARRVARREPPR